MSVRLGLGAVQFPGDMVLLFDKGAVGYRFTFVGNGLVLLCPLSPVGRTLQPVAAALCLYSYADES